VIRNWEEGKEENRKGEAENFPSERNFVRSGGGIEGAKQDQRAGAPALAVKKDQASKN